MCAVLTCVVDAAQLLAPTAVANQPRRVAQGRVGELLDRDDTAGAAVVAPIRPDLVVVDLDRCAEVVLPRLLDSADEVAAELVYLAASGSRDSVHAIFATRCNAARAALVDAITQVRNWARLDAHRVDILDGGRGIRLPGSASFKPDGSRCVPIEVDGEPLSAIAAATRARAALRATGRPLTYRAGRPVPAGGPSAAVSRDVALPVIADGVRAWRRRTPLTVAEQAVLDRSPQRGERSEAACAGAWVLWRHGVRDWVEASTFYDRPVFVKYRSRTDRGRSHWERQASQWASYRGTVIPAEQAVIDRWLAAGAHWNDGTTQATLVAVLQTFGDGRGLTARPIACRDLGLVLGCSPATAARRIRMLVELGVVGVARQWCDGPTQEATRYSLRTPPRAPNEHERSYRGVLTQDTDTPTGNPTPHPLTPALLHPTWAALGHTCRRLWELLADRLPTATLQALTHLPRGDSSHGLLHQLHRLVDAGLLRRTGTGRATAWERTSASLDATAERLGVSDRTHQLAEVVTAERAVWHADTTHDRTRATTRLAALRDRLHTRPARLGDTSGPRVANDLDAELAALVAATDTAHPPTPRPGRPIRPIQISRPSLRATPTTHSKPSCGSLWATAVRRLVQIHSDTIRQPRRTTSRADADDPG